MTIQKFQNLLEKGWSLDHMFILENMLERGNVATAPSSVFHFHKGEALLQTLFRKGMLTGEGIVTEEGKKLLEYAHNENIVEIVKTAKPKIAEGIDTLHSKLEGRLVNLTGKKQVRVDILGTKYSFLCGKEDLEARVKKVMIKYKLSDYQAIEDTLIRYIERCHKTNRWSPLLIYYMIKNQDGVEQSRMVTDMRNYKDEGQQTAKTDFEI